jgi:putative transposase
MSGVAKTGSFSQDARGRWYVNFQCEVEDAGTPLGDAEIGIDLGLKNTLACSDGTVYTRANITRRYAHALARAQQARKKKRVTALHAKSANSRTDFAHKPTTAIVNRASLVVVGNVSSPKLAGTRLAKSIYDAGWHQLRTMLAYKARRLGVVYTEINESGSSVPCAACLKRTGPRGLRALGVREWCCAACGAVHERDHNASLNILRWGRPTPCGNPPHSCGGGRQFR